VLRSFRVAGRFAARSDWQADLGDFEREVDRDVRAIALDDQGGAGADGEARRPIGEQGGRQTRRHKASAPASQIKVGDSVLTKKGAWSKILFVSTVEEEQTVYNFEVEGNHDYFVGATGVLVHNDPADCLRFALGKTQGLWQWASSMNADTYLPGSLNLPNELSSVTEVIANPGTEILVQLEESPGVIAQEVNIVAQGIESIGPTPFEQELQFIANNPQFWSRISFYAGRSIVNNPFE
jgi:hypothetical protein